MRLNDKIEHDLFDIIRMMDNKKPNLLIGVCKGLTFDQLKPFVRSAKLNIDNEKTQFVMISIDDKTGLNNELIQEGWNVVKLDINSTEQIHMERFKYVNEYLLRYGQNYDNVISCDVRDIVFQHDPFEQMISMFQDAYQHEREEYFGIGNVEHMRIKDEPWNRDNILNCFGPAEYEKVKNLEIMNVGIIAGTTRYVKEICFLVYTMSLNRNDWVSDQAAYNVLGNMTMFNAVTYYPTEWDAFSVNLHITHHPDCKEKYKDFWTQAPAEFIDGEVVYEDGGDTIPYAIVHQYDRDSEMLKYFTEMYK